jgi:hypothetical protein
LTQTYYKPGTLSSKILPKWYGLTDKIVLDIICK